MNAPGGTGSPSLLVANQWTQLAIDRASALVLAILHITRDLITQDLYWDLLTYDTE
jgi:hypothetical protein